MEKINVAELLKDCPQGMELNCTIYDNLYFDYIREHRIYPIVCYIVDRKGEKHEISFNWYGTHSPIDTAKCVIFPKGKTTWEGFVPPCNFKDGDIITCTNFICSFVAIFKEKISSDAFSKHAALTLDKKDFYKEGPSDFIKPRLATEEEKEKLFQAIKDNGYKWNAETKTLEKVIGPPNKFDLSTLVPFESRVLVRDDVSEEWLPAIWGFYNNGHKFPYITTGSRYRYCIPYESNEHLLAKTDDCDEYYKTW